MKETPEHIEKAFAAGEKSITEEWSASYTMLIIQALMNQYPYEFSQEIQKAFAQGMMDAAKSLKKVEEK